MLKVTNARDVEQCTMHDSLGSHVHFYDKFEDKEILHILKKDEKKVEVIDLDYA